MTAKLTALLFCDIALIIKKQTGIWYGSSDIANALARALCGERLAIAQPVSMMLALGNSGLRASPNRLPAVAAALNVCADTDRVTEAIVTVALMEVMRLAGVGVMVVTVSVSGDLSFETAGSLAELMKRRAKVTMAYRAELGRAA